MIRRLPVAAALLALAAPALAQSAADAPSPAQIARIIDEGQQHSQVMLTAQYMDDVIGPRLTNSPGMRKAEAWTQKRFADWGLRNVHKEAFDFGRGWWIERSSVRMLTPRPIQLTAIPVAWTPATNGPLSAPIIVAPMSKEADFARFHGQLAGKIVLVGQPGTGGEPDEPAFKRLSDADLAKLDQYQPPHYDPAAASGFLRYIRFAAKLDAFLKAEDAVAMVTNAGRDGKLVSGEGYRFTADDTAALPAVQVAAEDYRRLARLAKTGPAPTLEIDSRVHFEDADPHAYNIIAEIPGTDPKAGYVMAGAHLDSWVAGDGAADNGAGSAMVMEAARILAATGARPRRTIRFALWAGEEQGLLGSIAYLDQHLATRGSPTDPKTVGVERYVGYADRWPVTLKPGYADLAAYFNIDNGSGKLRGIYAENNVAAVPTLRAWLAPFAPMGAGAVVIQKTEGTDHELMQSIGLPAFQFIQDPLDYETRVHHSSMDTYDHLKADDMRQGSTVLAALLLDAADAKEPLPRAPLPTRPTLSDPFSYERHDD